MWADERVEEVYHDSNQMGGVVREGGGLTVAGVEGVENEVKADGLLECCVFFFEQKTACVIEV